MLNKYRVCLKAGANVCVSSVFVLTTPTHCGCRACTVFSLVCCFSNRGGFFLHNPPFCLIILFLLPLCLLSAVHSSLFLGLVVWRSSTHEQLDLWPWRDLSPLLPNHAHRWDVCFWFSLKEALRPCLCCCLYVCMHACVLLCQSHYYKYAVLQRVRLYLLGLIFCVLNNVTIN